MKKCRARSENLPSQLAVTRELLAAKDDSLHASRQQYFDKSDLYQLLVEEHKVLTKKLKWHELTSPKLVRWLAVLATVLFVVIGGLLVYIQRQQTA